MVLKVLLRTCLTLAMTLLLSFTAQARPSIEELKSRSYLDDYESNIVYGYNIVMDTPRYAAIA
jgi:hypothetical protein